MTYEEAVKKYGIESPQAKKALKKKHQEDDVNGFISKVNGERDKRKNAPVSEQSKRSVFNNVKKSLEKKEK